MQIEGKLAVTQVSPPEGTTAVCKKLYFLWEWTPTLPQSLTDAVVGRGEDIRCRRTQKGLLPSCWWLPRSIIMEKPWEALAHSSTLVGEPAPALIPVTLPSPPDSTLTTRHHLAPLLHSMPLRAQGDVSWWHGLLPGAKISLKTQVEHWSWGEVMSATQENFTGTGIHWWQSLSPHFHTCINAAVKWGFLLCWLTPFFCFFQFF